MGNRMTPSGLDPLFRQTQRQKTNRVIASDAPVASLRFGYVNAADHQRAGHREQQHQRMQGKARQLDTTQP